MKVHCPRHKDVNPSCEVYPESAWCFAGCGAIPLSEIGIEARTAVEREPEDLPTKYEYISQLDENTIRGFRFKYDDQGFYIQYPGSLYYALRRFDDNPRYIYPTGHQTPLFWANREGHKTLWLVEGQINALSIAKAFPGNDVCSPGAAGKFDSKQLRKNLSDLVKYRSIVLVVDADPAGIKAVIEAKGLLLNKVPYISYVVMEEDANAVMLKYGSQYLADEVKKKMS